MKSALLILLGMAAVTAQEQTGRIEGAVVDAVSHQPVKKATVSINFMGVTESPTQNQGPTTVTTDGSGAFAFARLRAGQYQLNVVHQGYPQSFMGGVQKSVQVAAGETASSVSVELVPGATLSGRVFDEDGDPMSGCMIQVHPAKNFDGGVPMMRMPMAREDGSYRLSGIPAGKYSITSQCMASVFQPRPLSAGPDPPPSSAYPIQFYPAATDLKSAEVVELLPGAEKTGIDFRMRPAPVTHIHGTLAPGSADWRGRNDLHVQLVPLDSRGPRNFGRGGGGQINPKDGSFELREVFPGSYRVVVFSQDFSAGGEAAASDQVGGMARVDVADKPMEVSLMLQRAVDISGTVEIEGEDNATERIAPSQINIQLTSESRFRPLPLTQVHEDGSFTIKSVLPGEWRIQLMGRSAFVKSARFGDDDITNRPLDFTAGSPPALRLVVSAKMATVRGTAPGGQWVFCARLDDGAVQGGWSVSQVDSNGQFTLVGLAPGKYRIATGESGGQMPEEGGQEVALREGETAMIELKPENKPTQ